MTVVGKIANTPQAWSERAQIELPWDAAGWSKEGQRARFQRVQDHLWGRIGADDSVLDFGSGPGCLYDWLPGPPDYYAYDWAEGMRKRVLDEVPRAIVLDVLPPPVELQFDHVIAIGPFNLADSWWKQRTWETLLELWALTRKNLLVSLYRGDDERCLSYTPYDLAAFTSQLEGLVRFQIDGDYLDNDLMLVARR